MLSTEAVRTSSTARRSASAPGSDDQTTATDDLEARFGGPPSTLICVSSVARDRDLVLIEEMLAPPPLEDARSSLEYWERRRKALPIYKRSARREAKEMAVRWEERARAAELAGFDERCATRPLTRLGISSIGLQRADRIPAVRMGRLGGRDAQGQAGPDELRSDRDPDRGPARRA